MRDRADSWRNPDSGSKRDEAVEEPAALRDHSARFSVTSRSPAAGRGTLAASKPLRSTRIPDPPGRPFSSNVPSSAVEVDGGFSDGGTAPQAKRSELPRVL